MVIKNKNLSNKIIVFEDKKIRRIWHKDEWWFSVVDVVEVLTDSPTPRQYWRKVKDREFEQLELSPIWVQLKLESSDGKKYLTDCANTKSLFRIIQSIPSKKAEPFKRWLAKVGYERVQEIENPELAQERMKELYEEKGYPKDWIEKRIRGIAIRQDLTDERQIPYRNFSTPNERISPSRGFFEFSFEIDYFKNNLWKNRGIEDKKDFSILTNEIAKATFGIGIKEHKKIKDLDTRFENQNLRDHMNDLELIFSMLGEKVTTEITKEKNSNGFNQCLDAGKKGGNVAGKARIDAEREIGKPVVSADNFLLNSEKKSHRDHLNRRKKKLIGSEVKHNE